MEAAMLEGGLALASGFGCASLVGYSVAQAVERSKRARAIGRSGDAGRLSWRLRHGVRPLVPAAEALLGISRVNGTASVAVMLLGARGVDASASGLVSVALVGLVLVGVVFGVAARSAVIGVVAAVAAAVIASMAVAAGVDKRRARAYEALPDALSSMAACFNAGFTLLQTFSQVANDVEGPLSEPFAQAAHTLETGGSAEHALEEIKAGSYSKELAFMAVALDVQHQSGGSMKQVLAAVSDTVRGDLELKRSLRVQTAQAKLSARIVSAMPLVLIVVFSLVSPGFLDPFFGSVLGMALLVLAIAMQVIGILLVRRALSVGGVS